MQSTAAELSVKIKTKEHLYEVLSKIYYLPAFSSKAITKEYLTKYCLKQIPIFIVKRVDIIHHNFRVKKHSSMDLLEILDGILKAQELPLSGCDIYTLPD
jgi:hypothetical protein